MSTHQDKENRGSAEERALDELRRRWPPGQPDEPPQLLDQAVLNAARRELEHDGAGRGLRWLGALATAAVVVLAVTLVVRQEPAQHPLPGASPKEKHEVRQEHPSAPATRQVPAPALSVRRSMESEAAAQSRGTGASTLSKSAADASPGPLRDEAEAEPRAAGAAATAPIPPQEWIQRLLELQAGGETRRFADEFEAFKRTYPDYPLPPQLQNREP